MALLWFVLGALSMLAALVLLLPWLRQLPGMQGLRAPKWPAGVGALLVLGVAFMLYRWLGHPELAHDASAPPAAELTPDGPAGGSAMPGTALPGAAKSAPAASMSSAVAGLEARLAKSGGSPADWELLAKSYEFMGLPDEARRARQHELPPNAAGSTRAPADSSPAASAVAAATDGRPSSGRQVSGEVSLAEPLRAKARAGATLFIVAKSVDAPGAPVAVFRSTVAAWPVRFTLDDSQSMLPGRNLTAAGRVTVEARISISGQAMPGPGDLQGSSGVVDPAERRPLKILIDHEIS